MHAERLKIWQQKAEWIISFYKKNHRWPSVEADNTPEKSYAIRMKKLRILYHNGELPGSLVKYLRKNNFHFARIENFEQKFNQLRKYVKLNSCLPPAKHHLDVWVRGLSGKKFNQLPAEQRKMLESIHFLQIPTARKRESSDRWETLFSKTKNYFDRYGKLPSRKDDKILNGWLDKQRRKLKSGQMEQGVQRRFQNAGIDLLAGTFTIPKERLPGKN